MFSVKYDVLILQRIRFRSRNHSFKYIKTFLKFKKREEINWNFVHSKKFVLPFIRKFFLIVCDDARHILSATLCFMKMILLPQLIIHVSNVGNKYNWFKQEYGMSKRKILFVIKLLLILFQTNAELQQVLRTLITKE